MDSAPRGIIERTTPEFKRVRLREYFESFVRLRAGDQHDDLYVITTEPGKASGDWVTSAKIVATGEPIGQRRSISYCPSSMPAYRSDGALHRVSGVATRSGGDFYDAQARREAALMPAHHSLAQWLVEYARRERGCPE